MRSLPSFSAPKNRPPPSIKLEGPGFTLPIDEASQLERCADCTEQPSGSAGTSSSHAALGNPSRVSREPRIPKNPPKNPPAKLEEGGELSPTATANTYKD